MKNVVQEPLQVIHVEDSRDDSELMEHLLKTDGVACEIHRVETRDQLERALAERKCDLILSDCTLPQFHGLEALKIARESRPNIPFIFVSGTIGEETAIQSLQNGATDYVLKQRLSRLIPAVKRALTEAEGRKSRRAMEAQLRQARKLEAIGTFAGGIVHDFRNLLQVMKLNIDLLGMVSADPDEVSAIAAQLARVTDRGSEMMEEIMAFTRKSDARLVPLDLNAQIRETARLMGATLPEKVRVTLDLEDNLPAAHADPCHVERIVMNLMGNARDAMAGDGAITISTDLVRFVELPQNLWHTEDAPYLRVRIADTGTGMDEETQARIFEPFFTTKPAGQGTGLGLSVVFGLMEAHHGYIDLTSQPGQGATFSLFFPLADDTTVDPARIQTVSPTQLLGLAQ